MNDKPLTEKQRATLGFVETYITAHGGKAPTFQEVADYFGISVHAADMRLRQCRDRGLITWQKNTPRSIVLLKADDEAPIANG